MGRLTWSYQVPELLVMLLLYSQVASYLSFSSSLPASSQLSHHDECIALLQFKNSFSIVSTASSNYFCQSSYPITESWKEDVDCCSWGGVFCVELTGHVHVMQLVLICSWLQGSIPSNSTLFTLPHLESLDLSYNNLSGPIPDGFGKLQSLTYLDLSYNRFYGWIPSSIFNLTRLFFLGVGYNQLVGNLPSDQVTGLSSPASGNQLNGTLPSLQILNLQGNQFTGQIPSSICNLTVLRILDLSNNRLSGKLPECLGSFNPGLSVLSLQMNSFDGPLPRNFSRGNSLRSLNLNGNQFVGPLPQSLIHCKSLVVLDLGNNNISDDFPQWLESLPNLQVLVLRSNRFHGPIDTPMSRNPFQRLRILDLSHNSFIGLLPTKFLENLNAMRNTASEQNNTRKYMGDKYGYYQDSVTVTMKDKEIVLVRILTIFTTIDLSSNKFEGQIPDIIGNFGSLKALNLSHNNISGHIPSSLGNMAAVESLDLSANMLQGEIPSQLTNLNFLEVLNLSHNLLEGPIPQGKQFNTFSNDSYLSNLELCGFPLSKKCRNEEEPVPQLPPSNLNKEDNSQGWFNWKIAAILGYGCGLVLGCSTAYIVFSTGKPWWFVKRVDGEWTYKVTRLVYRHKRRKVL